MDILEFQDVQDPCDNTKKERWLRVQAHDEDSTEGWIESRNVMPDDVLQASQKLAEEDNDIPAQATGQLRASSNLRLSPDRSGNENIMMRLDSGSSFEIVGWKRVPKPKASEVIESDVAPKAGSAQQGNTRGNKEIRKRTNRKKPTSFGTKFIFQLRSRPRQQVGFMGSRLNLQCRATLFFIAPVVSLWRGKDSMAIIDRSGRIKGQRRR